MTTCEASKMIRDGGFRPGSRGLYGAGIYFGLSCGIGFHKMDGAVRKEALAPGGPGLCCIKAELNMGKALLPLPGRPGVADWLTTDVLRDWGAQSVFAKVGPGGKQSDTELVVYQTSQVRITASEPYDTARAGREMAEAKEAAKAKREMEASGNPFLAPSGSGANTSTPLPASGGSAVGKVGKGGKGGNGTAVGKGGKRGKGAADPGFAGPPVLAGSAPRGARRGAKPGAKKGDGKR